MDAALTSHNHDAWMAEVCANGSDAELIAAGAKEYPGAPIGLSTWYDRLGTAQETIFNRVAHNRTRRPVFMRGAKQVLIRTHGLGSASTSANGWAIDVFWRAVRRMKLTALDHETFDKAADPIRARLRQKYYLTAPFDKATNCIYAGFNECLFVVGGERVFMRSEIAKQVSAFNSIIRKGDKIAAQLEGTS